MHSSDRCRSEGHNRVCRPIDLPCSFSGSRATEPDFRAHAAFIGFEVVAKEFGKVSGRGIIGSLVSPGVAGYEDLARHLWTRGHYLKAEDRVALRACMSQRPAVNSVNDRARGRELNALADAVRAAAPTGVHQPDSGSVFLYFS